MQTHEFRHYDSFSTFFGGFFQIESTHEMCRSSEISIYWVFFFFAIESNDELKKNNSKVAANIGKWDKSIKTKQKNKWIKSRTFF